MASWVDVQPNARRAGNNPEERPDEKQTIDWYGCTAGEHRCGVSPEHARRCAIRRCCPRQVTRQVRRQVGPGATRRATKYAGSEGPAWSHGSDHGQGAPGAEG